METEQTPTPNITQIKLSTTDYHQYLDQFYHHNALMFIGVIPEEAHLYRDYFKQYSEIDESKPCYIVKGSMMNRHYYLTDTNAYPDDLNILIFTLDTFKNIPGIAVPRFSIGGRWFDDVVDNNARRQEVFTPGYTIHH